MRMRRPVDWRRVRAQTAREGNAALPEVMVRAQVKGQALDEAQRSFSVTEFGSDEIREQPRQEVEALWNKVPGMHVNHYQLSGVANGLCCAASVAVGMAAMWRPRWTASRSTKPCRMPMAISI